jgi:phenolic acid decarboxylase
MPNHGIQVHHQSRSITDSNCITTVVQLRPSYSHDHRIQVCLQVFFIAVMKCISKGQRLVYSATRGTVMDRVKRSKYLAQPGVDRHHLISVSPYHIMTILTLCFATFGLTHSVYDFRHPQCRGVLNIVTRFG